MSTLTGAHQALSLEVTSESHLTQVTPASAAPLVIVHGAGNPTAMSAPIRLREEPAGSVAHWAWLHGRATAGFYSIRRCIVSLDTATSGVADDAESAPIGDRFNVNSISSRPACETVYSTADPRYHFLDSDVEPGTKRYIDDNDSEPTSPGYGLSPAPLYDHSPAETPVALTIDDIRDAGLFAVAAYGDAPLKTPYRNLAEANLAAYGLAERGWQWVPPTDFDANASVVDGYYDHPDVIVVTDITGLPIVAPVDTQILLAFNSNSRTLAISFRGTESLDDFKTDYWGGVGYWGKIYDTVGEFISNVIAEASTLFGASRFLISGHSLGGALVEEVMVAHQDTNLFGVSFGSPGIQEIDQPANTDQRLINFGQVDQNYQGDPVYRATDYKSYVNIQGTVLIRLTHMTTRY